MQIIQLILRAAQFLFVIVLLGITGWLVHDARSAFVPYTPKVPALTAYVLFCAAFGALTMILGFVACFVDALSGIVMAAFDGLSTLFFLAGSIALAVRVGVASCDPGVSEHYNGQEVIPRRLQNTDVIANGHKGDNSTWGTYDSFVTRCRLLQANDAFLFFALAAFATSLVFDFFGGGKSRRAGGGSSYV